MNAFDLLRRRSRPVDKGQASLLPDFVARLHAIRDARVLELGTRRSNPAVSTIHRDWAAADATFVRSDFEAGLDVDVVADVHTLSQAFPEEHFDAIIAASVWEHVQRPWVATPQVAKVLKPGGQIFIQTHQSFHVHGYPNDYWRFTREALETLFLDAGLRVVGSFYEFPAHIVSSRLPFGALSKAWLNVCAVGAKEPPD